jgi:hypothetical protein
VTHTCPYLCIIATLRGIWFVNYHILQKICDINKQSQVKPHKAKPVERTASTRYPGITSVGYNVVRLVQPHATCFIHFTVHSTFLLCSNPLQPQLLTLHIRSSAVARHACSPNTGPE